MSRECNKCIHYNVCCDWTSKEAIDATDEAVENGTCSGCNHFKPTADVVEVRHGEWVVKKLNNPFYESKKAPHCSECNYMCFIRYDYCPNCGAKMDGERREK